MAYDKLKTEVYEMLGGMNTKVSAYANTPIEFRDLTNLNFYVPGALSKRPGNTLYGGATISGAIVSGTEFTRLSGASYLIVSANTNLYSVTPSAFTVIKTGLTNGAIFDYSTFVDRLFCGNGSQFFKFDGSNTYNFSLPAPPSFTAAEAAGGSLSPGVTATFYVTYAYVNQRGYFGPAASGVTVTISGTAGGNSITYSGLTLSSQTTGYGVTAIALYRSGAGALDPAFTTFAISSATNATDTGFALTNDLTSDGIFFTLAPKYLEIYNNQLFMCGFTGSLASTAYWSEIGEPEQVNPEYFAEFRTNDGDILTGMKAYFGSLVFTKFKSVHTLTGDNPTNFSLQEVSEQFGCISNRSMVEYKNYLVWLDRVGIIRYTGANIEVFSNKMEPVFRSMNYQAAINKATAIHYRKYNEIWWAIPCHGATMNNTIVAYDYLSDAWTKYEGVEPSFLMVAEGAVGEPSPFFGGYTGTLFYFGSSLMSDYGKGGMTCSFKSAYHSPLGQTKESQFRQFYLNTTPILGVTANITVNLYKNFGESIQVTRQMSQSPFQNRIDFGIPARSLSAEVFHFSATLPFQINGYAIASRFQRDV